MKGLIAWWMAGVVLLALAAPAAAGDEAGSSDPAENEEQMTPAQPPEQSLGDVLSGAEGVRVATMCTNCNVANVTMCGQTGDKVQVWQDGLPVVGGLGAIYVLSVIPTEAIANTDVVRGAGTVLSGPEAGVGALLLRTKAPKKAPLLFASADVGSYNWKGQKLVASQRWGWFGGGLVATHNTNDGIDADGDGVFDLPNDKRTTVGGTATFNLTDRSVLRLDGASYSEDQRDSKGGYRGGLLPVEFSTFYHENIDIRRQEYAAAWDHDFRDASRLSVRGRYTHRDQDTSDDSVPIGESAPRMHQYMTVDEDVYGAEARYSRTLWGRHSLTAGVSYTDLEVDGTSNKISFFFPEGQKIRDEIQQRDAFVELGLALPANADVSLGLRYDDLTLSGARWVPALGELQSGIQPYENKESKLLPRLRAAWRASERLSLSLSAGDAFAPPRPSFERVCCGAVVLGNADVKPEKSRNYLLEADISPAAWLKIRPSVFRNETTNYIQKLVWALFPNYVFSYTQVNYPEATIQGGELSAEMRFWDRLSISLDGSYLSAEAEPIGVSFSFYGQPLALFDLPNGGEIPMLPKAQGSGRVQWDDPKTGLKLSAEAQYTGSMFIQHGTFGVGIGSAALEFVETPSYWVYNARAEKRVWKGLAVFAGVDNISGEVQLYLNDPRYEYNWGPLRGRYYYGGLSFAL